MLFLRACIDADTSGKVFFSDQDIQKYLLYTQCFGRSSERIGLFCAVLQDGLQTAVSFGRTGVKQNYTHPEGAGMPPPVCEEHIFLEENE